MVKSSKPTDTIKEEVVYIDFLNKEMGFIQDRIYFRGSEAYNLAVTWAKQNLDNFNHDMINYLT